VQDDGLTTDPQRGDGDGDSSRFRAIAINIVAVVVAALFVLNLIAQLVANSLCCADDAYYAVAARNIAIGIGYASTYGAQPGSGIVTFDPAITTGPVLILPAAAAVRLFGNRYWVPGSVVLVANVLLLAWLCVRLRRFAVSRQSWLIVIAATVVGLNLITIDHYEHWYALLGELPALLLLCIGLSYVWGDGSRWRYLAGGLLLGAAFQTKTLALFALPVVLVLVAWKTMVDAGTGNRGTSDALRSRVRPALGAVTLLLVGFLIPMALFEVFKIERVGVAAYRDLKARELSEITGHRGSGFKGLASENRIEFIRENVRVNGAAMAGYFNAPWAAFSFIACLALGFLPPGRWIRRDSGMPLTLFATAACYTIWWLFVSAGGRVRYLLIGLGLWCLGVIVDLATGERSLRKFALALTFALAIVPRGTGLESILAPRPLFAPSARTDAMLDTAAFLEANRGGKVVAASWWAAGADMEYLLKGNSSLVHFSQLDPHEKRSILFVENTHWNSRVPWVRSDWEAELSHRGASPIFERPPYRIFEATARPQPGEAGLAGKPGVASRR